MKTQLYNDGIGYVELIDSSTANLDLEHRQKFLADCASVCRGKECSSNPKVTYERVMKESFGGKPGRPAEFIPVVTDYDFFIDDRFVNFSYDDSLNYSTLRNLDYSFNKFNTPDKVADFKVFKLNLPMFVWAQIVTHTQISTMSQSDRICEVHDYWLPTDLIERLNNSDEVLGYDVVLQKHTKEKFLFEMINSFPQAEVQAVLRRLGYHREVYSRFPYYAKYKTFMMAAWNNNPLTYQHFINERTTPHTQKETREVALAMKRLLEN